MIATATASPALAMQPTSLPKRAMNAEVSPRRFKIYFQDDEVRRRSEENAHQLLATAMAADVASSNAALLAKKALKYRKVLDRMTGVDVTSPEFDASKFLGVDWCKTSSLKALRSRQH